MPPTLTTGGAARACGLTAHTGMPVAQMQRCAELVRAGRHTEAERAELLLAHREQVRAGIAEQQEHLAALDFTIDSYRRDARRLEETA